MLPRARVLRFFCGWAGLPRDPLTASGGASALPAVEGRVFKVPVALCRSLGGLA